MADSLRPAGLSRRQAPAWLVRLLGLAFVGLGLLFLLLPRTAAALFGLAVPDGEGFGYLPAIGLRDLAFGLYLLILSWTASERAQGLILAATLVIPAGDLLIVAAERGLSAKVPLLLHGASAAIIATASLWLLAAPLRLHSQPHNERGGIS